MIGGPAGAVYGKALLIIELYPMALIEPHPTQIPISEREYRTLTRGDSVGDRPRLEDSAYMAQLDAMVGLRQVRSVYYGSLITNATGEQCDSSLKPIVLSTLIIVTFLQLFSNFHLLDQ